MRWGSAEPFPRRSRKMHRNHISCHIFPDDRPTPTPTRPQSLTEMVPLYCRPVVALVNVRFTMVAAGCYCLKGRAMKAQKTATKTQVYFQQKRKCKINKTATCNFKSATLNAQIAGCCKYRHLPTDCFITVRMILDGRWDMSFAALRLLETRNATAATLLTLSE